MQHFITLAMAEAMTATYRLHRENILKDDYQHQNILALSETFDRESFDALINQSGCEGVRIYYGMDEDLKIHVVIVAVNAENEDILPSDSLNGSDEGLIIDTGNRCPELCPPLSALNS